MKRIKWTDDAIFAEALNYKTRRAFAIGAPGAYNAAYHKGILDSVCSHMPKNASFKWTLELAKNEAKTCANRSELKFKSPGCYKYLDRNALLDSVFESAFKDVAHYKRLIYAIIFDGKKVYVGMTANTNKRFSDHKTCGKFKHLFKDGNFRFVILTEKLEVHEASKRETFYINEYKSKGYKVLNKLRGGHFGSIKRKWTYDTVKELAAKETSRVLFSRKYPSAYMAAIRNGYWKEISKHMEFKSVPRYSKLKSDIVRI